MEKHILYYRIIESFKSPECPVCAFVREATEKYFDDLLYEGVSDFGFIRTFRKNRGFCNTHAHKLMSYKDGLAVASLYRYLSVDIVRALCSPQSIRCTPVKKCQACEFILSMEDMYFSGFSRYIDKDDEFNVALKESSGLCYPHYSWYKKKYRRNLPDWFHEFQRMYFERIESELERFIDSRNVTLGERRPDLTEEEQMVYQKAVRVFSGYEGMPDRS